MSRPVGFCQAHLIALLVFVLNLSRPLAADYSATEVGGGSDGQVTAVDGGYDVSSRGRDIGGNADQFEFAFGKRTGDFDVQTRVEGVTITDSFVHAGLMARESTNTGAMFAATFSSSALLGCFFESRTTTGGTSQQVAGNRGFPVNYPQTYLRLKRTGNIFTGFASFDGTNWQQLGTASAALPLEVLLGVALSSLNTNAVATGRFRDIQDVTSPKAYSYRAVETLGPSSRRTGLIFSEIMYNPTPRGDGEETEFIELFNAESVFLDLAGWSLAGAVHFDFPAGFRLESGQFAVIAADPGALERVYGLRGALGPYSGHLDNKGETLKLLNRAGATRLEVNYRPDAPWPVAADGGGHSLVLARPSYGEDDPRAWAASDKVGGSPGEVDAKWPNSWSAILINEVLANAGTGGTPFLELFNSGTESVEISGCVLTDDVRKRRYRIPAGTFLAGRSFLSLSQSELNFDLSASGKTIYLFSPKGDRVIDVIRYAAQETGVSLGRVPDGSPEMFRLARATAGASNSTRREEDVVINEIMYHPITGEDADTYVELHNRSNREVDLSGWRINGGIDFQFADGRKIPPQGFLVVAKNAARLLTNYVQLNTNNTVGDFSGKLSRNSDRIALARRDSVIVTNTLNAITTNTIYVAVSEVRYRSGGRWPELADGGGSSLELIDGRNDPNLAASWGASDESSKAPWTTVEVTTRAEMGSTAYPANRLQVLMEGAGECLVDNIELIPAGSTNVLSNGDFESFTNNWRFFGNHRTSAIEPGAAFNGQYGLHVRSPGDGDTGNNTIRGNLARAIPTSGNVTFRAKARWVAGWPEILFRVRGNWVEVPVRMEVPRNLGTPGLPNSRKLPNGAPAIYQVMHSPALPKANEAVIVTCRVSDPDGVTAVRLQYRVDPAQSLATVPMRDDGTNGDAVAGDGIYSATLSGRASRTLTAFRIEATDNAGTVQTFPSGAPAQECLILWDETIPFGTFAHYHMWSTAATEGIRASSPDLDNTFRDATLVYGNARVIYNVGFRDKGSPYHSGGGDFAVTVPKDDLLLGIDDRVFASTGNGGNEGTDMKGDLAGWVAEQMGIPFLHSHYMRLYRNSTQPYREVMYDMEQPNRYFAKSWFDGGGVKDDLFKIAIWFEFDDNNSSFSSVGATLERFLSNGQYKLPRYRWNWQLRPSTDTANDYSSIFNLAAAANSGADRTRLLPLLADMEEWMRVFGYHRVTGNWDSYTYNVGQNMYLYAALGQRATLLPWDIDFVLGDGDGATAATLFTSSTDPVMQQIFNLPMYRRMLWRAYQDAVNGPLVTTNFQPQIEARRAALRKNGVSAGTPTSITSYMNSRRNYLANQLKSNDTAGFAITTHGGADFSSSDSLVSLTGTAPFAVAAIQVNGVPYPLNWTSVTNWQTSVPLGAGSNTLRITGIDLRGNVLTGAVRQIHIAYNGPVPKAEDWVVLNELNYHSAAAKGDYIELYNRNPGFTFDLSGYQVQGIGYTFPNGTLIQPNGYLVIVENRAAFAAAYDPLLPVLGPYSGKLQADGETIRLVKPGDTIDSDVVVDEVKYSNAAPWPITADGQGPSLQLIDPAQDNWRVGNWAATRPNDSSRTTPGRQNSVRSQIDAFPNLWVNEVKPLSDSATLDNFQEPSAWIELANTDSTTLDLSGFSLSDDPANLGKWQFASGTRIEAGKFLVVWADGNTGQSTALAPHTSFSLGSTNGMILLSRMQGGTLAVIDFLNYLVTRAENSFGSYPDGDPRHRRMLFTATPGAPNDPTIPNVAVSINEWMAAEQSVIRDPADGQFQPWFELYNAGTNTVDLSGFYLTHTETDKTLFQIPAGYQIAPGEYRVVWADSQPEQNGSGPDLHVNFTLNSAGDQIGLYTPDQDIVRLVAFGPQAPNVSEGLHPDGSQSPPAAFSAPTPGKPNIPQFANRPASITPVGNQSVDEGALVNFRVVANDPDLPTQVVRFALNNAPPGATIDPVTGEFTWRPGEEQGPGNYGLTIRATDDGTPPQSASLTFRVAVHEVNTAPTILPIPDQAIAEGVAFSYTVAAADSDLPVQHLTFALEANSPAGATIDGNTGEFQWTPSEEQGPGNYTITIRVADDGQPPLSATQSFRVTVREINNAPLVEPIPIQTVAEGSEFTYQVQAHDPDTPPVALIYELENAPAGMRIDRISGTIEWIPQEAQAPGDYNITVRVSEPGGTPSGSTTFLIGTREVNVAPTLQPIANLAAGPGDKISIQMAAADIDLPPQALTFSAVGALPGGATISSSTGLFSWAVPRDPVVGTNRITIRVADDATPPLTAEQSFDIIVRAPARIAINEIMHNPPVANARYVELANYSAVSAVDLSGWRLEGYEFQFASGTTLAPGAFLCVAADPGTFVRTYGTNGIVVGPATLSIGANGGAIRLIKPGAPGFPDEVVDETAFSLNSPWPAAASKGAAIQLIDPWQDHRRVNNWDATFGTTNTTVPTLPITAKWNYWQNATFPGTEWMTEGFNDSIWPSGGALLYVEGDALPAAKVTALNLGQLSYYFRTHFNFSGNPQGAVLRFNTVIDDGAVFYLNGQEVFRMGMPTGPVQQNTTASRTVGNAAYEGPFDYSAANLHNGDNVLAVEVHQANATSSDVVLGATLDIVTTRIASFTPNEPNAVARALDPLAPVWINELMPDNTATLSDGDGAFGPWIELFNASDAPVTLAGWSLTDDFAQLTKWTFPDSTTIPARGFLLVWGDGNTSQNSSAHPHTSFRMSAASGHVALAARQNGATVVVDYLNYTNAVPDQSIGLTQDGNPLTRAKLAAASPGASNNGGSSGSAPTLHISLASDQTITLNWTAASGRSYRIESTASLTIPNWITRGSGVGTGQSATFSEGIEAAGPRFYRVVLP